MAVDCTILAFVQFGSIALANPTCRHCGVIYKATNDGGQARSLIFTDIQGDSAVPRSPTTSAARCYPRDQTTHPCSISSGSIAARRIPCLGSECLHHRQRQRELCQSHQPRFRHLVIQRVLVVNEYLYPTGPTKAVHKAKPTLNHEVVGSIPTWRTKLPLHSKDLRNPQFANMPQKPLGSAQRSAHPFLPLGSRNGT